jgi:hypothetical protein
MLLARVMIAAFAIAPAEREAWLMRFAEQPKTCTSGDELVGSAAVVWGPAGSKPAATSSWDCPLQVSQRLTVAHF